MEEDRESKRAKIEHDTEDGDLQAEQRAFHDAQLAALESEEIYLKELTAMAADAASNVVAASGVWMLRTVTVWKGDDGQEQNEEKFAFFMMDEKIRFRHQGDRQKRPDLVYLPAEIAEGERRYLTVPISNAVPVYFSASGSGKTVELAVCSVTHKAHLTLLLAFEKGDDLRESKVLDEMKKDFVIDGDVTRQEVVDSLKETVEWKRVRNRLALSKFGQAIKGLVDLWWSSFKKILEMQPEDGLKLVVGIDEASTCPIIVRSILSSVTGAQVSAKKCLYDRLLEDSPDAPAANKLLERVSFSFSIAGTGAANSTLGSSDADFVHQKTSAMAVPYLYPRMALTRYGIKAFFPRGGLQVAGIDQIKTQMPVLYCMMENARMASIAISILRHYEFRDLVEKQLVDKVCELFIASNGMWRIREDRKARNAVGACSLAVYLFQEDIPDFQSQGFKERYYKTFMCGVFFDISVTNTFADHIHTQDELAQVEARRNLVATFALLEPNMAAAKRKPFEMRPSQQLIALSLLGIKLSNLVRADPFGFEILSTHTIKAALAASSALAWQHRVSVRKALEKVGCTEDQSADKKTNDLWDDLDKFYVIRHEFRLGTVTDEEERQRKIEERQQKEQAGTPTRILNAELSVVTKTVKNAKNKKVRKKVLYIERGYREDLAEVIPQTQRDDTFRPPIAAVNYGNSDLADGYVTCLVARREWAKTGGATDGNIVWNQPPVKFSAMNQAKDKLGYSGAPKGSLDVARLRDHARKCYAPILNGCFGEKRLLFVSTPTDNTTQRAKSRPWLPRTLDESNCAILAALMSTLHFQRTLSNRQTLFCDCVDASGAIVEEDAEDTDDDGSIDGTE